LSSRHLLSTEAAFGRDYEANFNSMFLAKAAPSTHLPRDRKRLETRIVTALIDVDHARTVPVPHHAMEAFCDNTIVRGWD
jgi:hypothetical protein